MNIGELKAKVETALERLGPEAKVSLIGGYTPGEYEPKLHLDLKEKSLIIECPEPGDPPQKNWQEI